MTRMAAWLGAGALTAGMSAALLAGAATASADTDGGSESRDTRSTVTGTTQAGTDTGPKHVRKKDHRRPNKTVGSVAGGSHAGGPLPRGTTPLVEPAGLRVDLDKAVRPKTPGATRPQTAEPSESTPSPPPIRQRFNTLRDDLRNRIEPARTELSRSVAQAAQRFEKAAQTLPDRTVLTTEPTKTAISTENSVPLMGPFQPDYPPLVRAIGSAVFNLIGAVVQIADGPPIVPPALRDSIQVSSSTLVIAPGTEVPADWYFPTEGNPTRLIYLQHGFLASGPMYSYTASYLAERTNSVVVVTTLTSNPFADGGMWLGGDNMHKAVAQLFLDEDREALNASLTTATLKAGRSSIAVPQQFALAGHSLGGGFAPGVAGHYAEGLVVRRGQEDLTPGEDGYANDLAGVVILDAVPMSPILPNALARLKQLELSNDNDPHDYVPIYEIGAPLNYLNSASNVNDELSAARPGKFNGVVINDGVHMDAMLGGNPLIQIAAYLVAGIPQPQNPPAVQQLMAGWINDMFDGNIDPVTGRCLETNPNCQGSYGNPGDTITVSTESGTASAIVINSGTLPVWQWLGELSFVPAAVNSIVVPR